jgi:hypothetical protein
VPTVCNTPIGFVALDGFGRTHALPHIIFEMAAILPSAGYVVNVSQHYKHVDSENNPSHFLFLRRQLASSS